MAARSVPPRPDSAPPDPPRIDADAEDADAGESRDENQDENDRLPTPTGDTSGWASDASI